MRSHPAVAAAKIRIGIGQEFDFSINNLCPTEGPMTAYRGEPDVLDGIGRLSR